MNEERERKDEEGSMNIFHRVRTVTTNVPIVFEYITLKSIMEYNFVPLVSLENDFYFYIIFMSCS